MLRFNPTTPIRFYSAESAYIPGDGQTTAWVYVGVLYCEWKGSYGQQALVAQSQGVNEMATIRTFFHPDIYSALQSKRVIVIKNNDESAVIDGAIKPTNPNVYEVWGGVDNVGEHNQHMEFRVKRYEGK